MRTNDEIREIFGNVLDNKKHGHFLTYFAKAIIHADGDNFKMLKLVAIRIINKYGLS